MKQKFSVRRKLLEVLQESKNKMTPKHLFRTAGFKPEEVEDFYT